MVPGATALRFPHGTGAAGRSWPRKNAGRRPQTALPLDPPQICVSPDLLLRFVIDLHWRIANGE